ncbi:MAG: hypothetical protein H0V56_04405 [Chthoniobacterales bacterium]|nr:hypothetical protein [Chthoniobacterales bacterium]
MRARFLTHCTFAVFTSLLVISISLAAEKPDDAPPKNISQIAEAYVHLVLAMGQHDKDYVDAFYGPAEWKAAAEKEKKPLDAIREEAMNLFSALSELPVPEAELDRLRHEYLAKQLSALEARVRIVKGDKLKFDDETRALYDAVAPTRSAAHFDKILAQLEEKIPGDGPLTKRYEEWRKRFVIPKDKLDAVFQLAIDECRKRTAAHLELPADESFTVEYVTGKSWSGYNWYQGNYRSLIQVNTDLPVYIDRAVDLAAHEGYPGHHVYNVLLEKNLVRDRGWVEFSVYALFSPQSLIAEGTANYGQQVVFTEPERMKFEREVLFPAAGIDPKLVEEYYAVQKMTEELSYAGNEAARQYLNGEIDAAAAADWLEKRALMERKRAEQRVRFIEQYRSYVINYNLGEDLVREYVEKNVEHQTSNIEHRSGADPERAKFEARWKVFGELLSSPRLPSGLR